MKKNNTTLYIVLMILGAAACRLLTNYFHLWNFTPIAAMGLFAGANMRDKKLSFLVPFIALFLTDLVLGLHKEMFSVYASVALIVFIGMWLEKRQTVFNIFSAALVSSVLFYGVTNFFAWISNPLYTQDVQGLIRNYTLALPFFRNEILGDLFFSGVLFGGYALLMKREKATA